MTVKNMISSLMNQMVNTVASAKRLIVPISGGSDSALTFSLLSKLYPDKTMGIYIGSDLREKKWFEETGPTSLLDVGPEIAKSETYRWATILNYTLLQGGWLVGSRTKTEDLLGTYSLASRVATYLPLVNIWKTDVMAMCKALKVPKAILDSSRKADPDCGRSPEMAEIPLEVIDNYLKYTVSGLGSVDPDPTPEQMAYLGSIRAFNQFKSMLPIKHKE